MTPAELSRTVLRSVRGAVDEQELSVPVPARVVVRRPPRPGCGDYASNVALQLAQAAGRPAREVAEVLQKRLAGCAGIARVEIAGPGFLNFTLDEGAQTALVRGILAQGARYGTGSDSPVRTAGGPARLPDGARGVVVGEALERIDAAAGGLRVPSPGDGAPASGPARAALVRLVARLGADEVRWALLRPAAHDPVRLPARPEQRESNPRFRVQYAHARALAVVRNARELGFAGEPGDEPGAGEGAEGEAGAARPVTAVASPAVASAPPAHGPRPARPTLNALLAGFPDVVEAAARHRAPDRLVRHLEAVADAFFRWHDGCQPLPVGEEKPSAVHRARVAVAEATGTVLANGLRLLGISAPEHL
ncbi:ArgS-related anticodon-binding protein NrtL [Streptomyces sp. NPDC048644]|uniref:ArgS-related anticodon-binding protein NrtL n=1 Tax=Streptomyces sp. NPDC048644 TaxID=3365582 RepID=UPI00371AF085